jgi:hypothetical protein
MLVGEITARISRFNGLTIYVVVWHCKAKQAKQDLGKDPTCEGFVQIGKTW